MIKNKYIISFDFGTKIIGVAIGNLITLNSRPLGIIKVFKKKPDWLKINHLINIWSPKLILVGLPLNMDGSEQHITLLVKKFAKKLKNKFNIKIILKDERLSTYEARSNLFCVGGYNALKKCKINKESAVVILNSWLQMQSNSCSIIDRK